ncbi:DUF6283 family protein [Streptomyces lydicus]|uniref:DUF6283 family protein n=1 Tax=Streptomyces lydicus TaxID=47763 RepID=UPI0010138A80|nr:DUF6283 family protein [Streptomyces lydicus]MCZ1012167.1 DUF6283 family protein [Streptomyces lydicus]
MSSAHLPEASALTPWEFRSRPCAGRCPWIVGTNLADFSDADFAKLERANGTPDCQAGLEAPNMACHLDQPGTAHALRLCAGWLAVVGHHHHGVILAVLSGRLPETVLEPGDDWPELHPDLDTMIAERALWQKALAPKASAADHAAAPGTGPALR